MATAAAAAAAAAAEGQEQKQEELPDSPLVPRPCYQQSLNLQWELSKTTGRQTDGYSGPAQHCRYPEGGWCFKDVYCFRRQNALFPGLKTKLQPSEELGSHL
nr:unnamed protein product [Spirometra erinaceieuropaei]